MTNNSIWCDETGTSAIEYVALAALVAVGLIALMSSLGDETSDSLSAVDTAMAGNASAEPAPAPQPSRRPVRPGGGNQVPHS
ncbi:Flp family type IVb pilin [Aurantiacibacter flavus]|uniref:Flp family type IVb pilin n=1 Tax=Aurantiacibacter flavus TaxID=3145232 RepID=A0ABV0CVN9_9SPHN